MSSKIFTLFLSAFFSFTQLTAQDNWVKTSALASPDDNIYDIEVNNTGTVFASVWANGIYRSNNEGETWVFSGLPGARVYDIAISPGNHVFAFATTTSNHSIHRSTDDGLTWNEVYNANHQNNFASGGGVIFSDSIAVAALSFTLGPTIGIIGVDIVRSTDYGATWQFVVMLNGLGFANDLTLHPDGRIFAASSLNGIVFSSNMGSNWLQLSSFPPVYTEKIKYNSGNIYLGRNTAGSNDDLMFKSTDNGSTWFGLGLFTNQNGGNTKSLYIDENNVVYAAMILYGPTHFTIYKSTNGGSDWVEFYEGIPADKYVNCLAGKDNVIFAGTANDGVYKRVLPEIPVELISFNTSVTGNSVTLNWSTAAETNNRGFEIERSPGDGRWEMEDGEWEKLDFVEGKGTTTEQQVYSYTDKNLSAGKYLYRLKQIDYNGTFEYKSVIAEAVINYTAEFSLKQNFPNPFNPSTTIKYFIKEKGWVTVKIYDAIGSEISTLVSEFKSPGSYEIQFSNNNLPSGIYFCRLEANGFSETKRMMLLK